MNGDETEGLGAVGVNPVAATEGLKPLERLGPAQMERASKKSRRSLTSFHGRSGADAMERQRNGVRTCPAHGEWRAALLWPSGL